MFVLGCRQVVKALGFDPSRRRFKSYQPSFCTAKLRYICVTYRIYINMVASAQTEYGYAAGKVVVGSIPTRVTGSMALQAIIDPQFSRDICQGGKLICGKTWAGLITREQQKRVENCISRLV